MDTGTISVIMVFSIPIIAIITGHLSSTKKLKSTMIKDELELEKTKQQNYLIETEKMKVELEKMKLELETKDRNSHALPSYKKADVNELLPEMKASNDETAGKVASTSFPKEEAPSNGGQSDTALPSGNHAEKDVPSDAREKVVEYVRVR
ncbi:hypothetical protein [Paenisporosarcina cavernae]|uniref:hypothetical protein n=1 Tax=Paenisporosarcina cavernae TaxID=2320858 RepID=UPI00269F3800